MLDGNIEMGRTAFSVVARRSHDSKGTAWCIALHDPLSSLQMHGRQILLVAS